MQKTYSFKSPKSFAFSDLPFLKKVKVLLLIGLHSYFLSRIYAFVKYGYLFEKVKWEVKSTQKKGEGLFITESVPKGTLVFVARGPVAFGHFEEQDCYLYPDWYMVENDIWIDIQYPYIKLNHSCEPNLGIDTSRCFVALRDITKGEELTFDYSITDNEEDWQMECYCGADSCRRTVRSIQHTPSDSLMKSFPYLPGHFKKHIYL